MIQVDINGKSVPADEVHNVRVLAGRLLRYHPDFLNEALESGLSELYACVTSALEQIDTPIPESPLDLPPDARR